MTGQQRRQLRSLEGRMVHLALVDGSRIDDVALLSVTSRTVWIFVNGEDVFLPTGRLVDVWEAIAERSAA